MMKMTTPTSRALGRARIGVGANVPRLATPGVDAAWTQGTNGSSPMCAPTGIEHDGTTTRLFRTRST